jgi:hypothetical protein
MKFAFASGRAKLASKFQSSGGVFPSARFVLMKVLSHNSCDTWVSAQLEEEGFLEEHFPLTQSSSIVSGVDPLPMFWENCGRLDDNWLGGVGMVGVIHGIPMFAVF